MSVTPTGRSMNVTACQFTPGSGSAIPITGVKDVSVNPNAKFVSAGGDGDLIDSIGGVNELAPEIAINTNKAFQMNAVAPGTIGVLTFIANDFRNGVLATGGGVTYTVSNAVYVPGDQKHVHRDFGTLSLTFKTFAPDGLTNPVAYAAL